GYHPVQIGDSLNRRYQVVSKLGWGFFSTVWLCMDLSGRRVAVKVLKSGAGFAQAGQDEQALLRYSSSPVSRHPSSQRIVQLLDEFKLVGVNGVLCLVLELLGPSLRTWQLCLGNPGLMQPWVKQILTQVLQGLDYLHTRCKIIHTDIKPENILLHPKEHLKEISVKIADLGSSCWVYKHFSEEIQTRQYRSLEVLLGSEYGPPADIWSVACMHIGQIVELLGRIPPEVLHSGKHSAEYFDRRNLRRVDPVRPWRLYDVLVEKYNFLLEEASEFSNFLLHMLDYHTERRATAAQCLQHPWL
uniref:non-specific serine/threonine protein kinase n=1 Tax=Poecilia latipinna TaxID=48699 RepID=A0A3B3U9L6_9TELE